MADLETLRALLARVEKAVGPDRELDGDLWLEFFAPDAVAVDFNVAFPPITASIDAALALVEKVLPGWFWTVDGGVNKTTHCRAAIVRNYDPTTEGAQGYAATPALAVLFALLRALIAQQDTAHVG